MQELQYISFIAVETYNRIIQSRDRVYTRRSNIAADILSKLPSNGNQGNTHESTYTMENMLELYIIEKLS